MWSILVMSLSSWIAWCALDELIQTLTCILGWPVVIFGKVLRFQIHYNEQYRYNLFAHSCDEWKYCLRPWFDFQIVCALSYARIQNNCAYVFNKRLRMVFVCVCVFLSFFSSLLDLLCGRSVGFDWTAVTVHDMQRLTGQ